MSIEYLKQSVSYNSFAPALYINDQFIEFCILFNGEMTFDDEDDHSLLSRIKQHWSKTTWMKDIQGNIMLWSGNCGPIFTLDEMDIGNQVIENLKSDNLTFILYEPLSLYRKGIENKFVDHKNYDQFESTEENLELMYAYELDSIENFAKKHNFERKITVYCCNFRVKQYLQHKYHHLDLFCRDIFVSSDSFTHSFYRNWFPKKVPHKKFMCLNRRYTGSRHMTMIYLASTKNFFSGNYSWNVLTDFPFLEGKLWYNFAEWKYSQTEIWDKLHRGIDVLNEVVPLNTDNENPWVYHIADPLRQDPPPVENKLPKFKYAESFVTIVTETRFAEPMGNFSEKVTNVMKCFRPFIVIGPPKTLEYLKILGFKTFGGFWDESYDDELNHEKRLMKLFKLIDYIDSLSWYDQKHILENMNLILSHNAAVLKDLPMSFPAIPY